MGKYWADEGKRWRRSAEAPLHAQGAQDRSRVAGTGFVEVSVTPWTVGPQWVIQLEDQIGSKLTLRLAAGGSAEALAMAQGLWRHRS